MKLTTEYFEDTGTIECYSAGGEFQGRVTVDSESDVTLGITDYVGKGSGMIILRETIPESELSEYNVVKCLLDSVKDRGLVKDKYLHRLVPEEFGYKSVDDAKRKELYEDMTKDQLINELVDMKLQIESLKKVGLI